MTETALGKKKPTNSKKRKKAALEPEKNSRKETDFPIVGIGASAGGLQAIEAFFAILPADCNMAFVIVLHQAPHHESRMNSLLSKQTPLRVNDIRDKIPVEINQVYITPPGKDVVIQNRTLCLQDAHKKKGLHFSIDTFFRSLAEDQKEKAVCIVLSGANNDGTLGAKQINQNTQEVRRLFSDLTINVTRFFRGDTAFQAFLENIEADISGERLKRFLTRRGNRYYVNSNRKFLLDILPRDSAFEGYEVAHEFPGIGRRIMFLNARKISPGEERSAMILLSFRDVTGDR
ncbi:MAG: hypothetical protein LC660_11860 [Desulfobacteraceae bacterium]|nr:hypothetical protein [Desulfobacteraceae bacterium]